MNDKLDHPYDADERGCFGDFGGRFMPEALVAALDELTEAWQRGDGRPGVRRGVRRLILREYAGVPSPLYDAERLSRAGRRPDPAQAGGPQPHRRPQDPQRARPGAAHPADGQDPGDRRDRGRPARRRQRHGGGVLRPRLHRLHGLGRREAAGAQRRPDAAARRPGGPGRLRQRHAEGRHQRGAARLGRQRRPHGVPLRDRRRPAPVPQHGPRLRPRHRRRGPRAVPRALSAGCPTRSPPASAAAPTRSGCSRRSSTTDVAIYGFEAGGDGVETGRHAATIHAGDSGVLHGARTFVLQDEDGQTIESHSISAGLDYPGVGPQHAHLAETGRASYLPGHRRRGDGRARAAAPAPRASSRPSSRRTRWPGAIGSRAGAGPEKGRAIVLINLSGRGDKDMEHRDRVVRPRRRRTRDRGPA